MARQLALILVLFSQDALHDKMGGLRITAPDRSNAPYVLA